MRALSVVPGRLWMAGSDQESRCWMVSGIVSGIVSEWGAAYLWMAGSDQESQREITKTQRAVYTAAATQMAVAASR